MKILLLADIHGNFPALEAVAARWSPDEFDAIIHAGDATVYAPFPNETLAWLREHGAISILGNTDHKVRRLLRGKSFKKPRKAEKRIMYTWTADHLSPENAAYLSGMKQQLQLEMEGGRIGVFHGSPASPDEFLFSDTPTLRFQELTRKTDCSIIITGHSHTPYHKKVLGRHFINPGSVGRMFDGNPAASWAVLELNGDQVRVRHFRTPYDVDRVVRTLAENLLPPIYGVMYRQGRKLN
ncbi:metallophosphoesterase family protein [Desulfolithobacter sp.]